MKSDWHHLTSPYIEEHMPCVKNFLWLFAVQIQSTSFTNDVCRSIRERWRPCIKRLVTSCHWRLASMQMEHLQWISEVAPFEKSLYNEHWKSILRLFCYVFVCFKRFWKNVNMWESATCCCQVLALRNELQRVAELMQGYMQRERQLHVAWLVNVQQMIQEVFMWLSQICVGLCGDQWKMDILLICSKC